MLNTDLLLGLAQEAEEFAKDCPLGLSRALLRFADAAYSLCGRLGTSDPMIEEEEKEVADEEAVAVEPEPEEPEVAAREIKADFFAIRPRRQDYKKCLTCGETMWKIGQGLWSCPTCQKQEKMPKE